MDKAATKIMHIAANLNKENIATSKSQLIQIAHDILQQQPLPSGWRVCYTKDNKIYFQNDVKKTTQWKRPAMPKKAETNVTSKEIDNILNEIDETEKKDKTPQNAGDVDKKELFEIWDKALEEALYWPSMKKLSGDSENVTKERWCALFRKRIGSSEKRHLALSPFMLDCEVRKADLEKIFDEIPKSMKYDKGHIRIENPEDGDALCIAFKEWLLNYKSSTPRIQRLQKCILDSFKRFGIWYKFYGMADSGNIEEITAYYEKNKEYINLNDNESYGDTVLHTVAYSENGAPTIQWLLSLKGIDHNIQNKQKKTPLDNAKECGYWDIVEMLSFADMSDKMRQKSDDQVAKLNRVEGMVKQWFRFYDVKNKQSNEFKSMQRMCEAVKTLIKKRLPISDDMLMLCFNFELQQNNGDPLKCSLWKFLFNTLNEILRIPLNRRNWLWFKQYIFESSLWYQKIKSPEEMGEEKKSDDEIDKKKPKAKQEKLLYQLLIEMVSKQLQAQRDYLLPYINKLENDENKENSEQWTALKNYPEFIVTDNPEGLYMCNCSLSAHCLIYSFILHNSDVLHNCRNK